MLSLYRRKLFITILIVIFVLSNFFTLFTYPISPGVSVAYAASTGNLIQRVYTDKARYNPGDLVTISADLINKTGSTWSGTLTLQINKLESQIYTASQSVTLANGDSITITFTWTAPPTDFVGYYAGIAAGSTDFNGTGIDVSSSPLRFPRYGFISNFPVSQTAQQSTDMVKQMVEDYHLNLFQFYDWMWRHEKLIKRTNGVIDSTWVDLFDRTLSWQTIQNNVAAVHSFNAYAMAYAMSYAAREGYEQMWGISPTWGIFQDTAHQSQFNVDFHNGKFLWLFNPANVNWQTWIISEYKDAINTAGFDGIQIDQMGQRDNVYDYTGFSVTLPSTFAQFLQQVKSELESNNAKKNVVTFNIVDGTVNGWAAGEIARYGASDFDFSEIWWKANTYNDLRNYIEWLRQNNGGKPVVLAAYMNYNQEYGPIYEAESAILSGVSVNTNHPGYTGTGFVDGFETVGDSITWTIDFPETGDYSFVFRYANATGATATRNVYVDGRFLGQVSFANQVNWDTWAADAWIQIEGLTAGTHSVTLKYDSDNIGAINVDHLTLGEFEENSVRLADAMMFASGATHIELGDTNQMLAHEYYPNRSKSMRNSLKAAMRDYYSFATAYENLLFDPDIVPADQGNQWIALTTGQPLSGNGTFGTIWQMVKRKSDYDIIHLINLMGNDDQWRNPAVQPTFQSNIGVKYYPGPNAAVSGVYLASPDLDHGMTIPLTYTTGNDSRGNYIQFAVPSLKYWDMIYVKRTITTPPDGQYEAEYAIKSGTNINTDHTGYTGSGFVDNFDASGKGVSFIINVPTSDTYTLRFRYGNGGTTIATRNLFIDGQYAGTLQFRNLHNWDVWDTVETTVWLSAGVHQMVLWYSPENDGAINLDNLIVLQQTTPARTSARSFWMNNWSNLIGIHMASKLSPTDNGNYGPRLAELHFRGDWPTNQIVDATAFFRDETDLTPIKYTNAHSFDSEAWFENDGTLTVRYLNYNGSALPVQITKQYAMVPNQNFLVIKYTFLNQTSSARTLNFLEQVHLNNKTSSDPNPRWQHGWWDVSRNALGTDMSQTGQFYIELGAFQTMDSYQVGNDADSNPNSQTSSPWYQFDANGVLNRCGDLWSQNLSMGFQKLITVPAGGSVTLAFYYAIGSTQEEAEAAADLARSQTADYWFTQTAAEYNNWLNSGQRVNTSDIGINTAFDRSLIINKQAQHPEFGSWPAATNPSYQYKVWVRDSAVTAMGMDATNHLSEAEKYWNWMASVQNTDGTWHTNYNVWKANEWIAFVEPEHDAIGLFLIGVYQHYSLLKSRDPSAATTFLNNIWTQVTRAGDFIYKNIDASGFGPADASIWEEQVEYNIFTQVTYATGLNAGRLLAQEKGDITRANNYLSGAQIIKDAILRSFLSSPRGLWNESNRYFNRAINTDGTARTTVDASSDLIWVFGLLSPTDTRIRDHLIKVLSRLTHDGYGIARYENDEFYHSSPYSPGGQYEAGAAEPVWPQMTMYASMIEHWRGDDATALARLKWYVSRTARGYVTPGEAVDWTNGQPLISTAVEPVTGSWFQMAVLTYLNRFDPRLPDF